MDNVYKQRLEEIKKKYNTRIGAMNKTIADDTTCLNTLDALRTALDVDLKVLALLEKTAAEARLKAKVYLENVVTNALQYISGGVYTFEIDIQELRVNLMQNFTWYLLLTVISHDRSLRTHVVVDLLI
jgi:hypothetical protein